MLNKSHESWMNVQSRGLSAGLDETDVKILKVLTVNARLSSIQIANSATFQSALS